MFYHLSRYPFFPRSSISSLAGRGQTTRSTRRALKNVPRESASHHLLSFDEFASGSRLFIADSNPADRLAGYYLTRQFTSRSRSMQRQKAAFGADSGTDRILLRCPSFSLSAVVVSLPPGNLRNNVAHAARARSSHQILIPIYRPSELRLDWTGPVWTAGPRSACQFLVRAPVGPFLHQPASALNLNLSLFVGPR